MYSFSKWTIAGSILFVLFSEEYSKSCQTSKMERLAKLVAEKSSLLDVWQDSKYASDLDNVSGEWEICACCYFKFNICMIISTWKKNFTVSS